MLGAFQPINDQVQDACVTIAAAAAATNPAVKVRWLQIDQDAVLACFYCTQTT